MVTASDFVALLLSQDGDKYVFGAEVSPSDSDPKAFDCSELVQWGCARLGVSPTMPDGSWIQLRHCRNHGMLIPVSEAIDTKGALLFSFSSDPFTGGRPKAAHVAVSQGNGLTIEARSTRHGVGQFTARNRGWTHAALVPGITYDLEDEMAWLKPGDHVEDLDDVRAVHAWQGHRIMTPAEIAAPGNLDLKVAIARVTSLMMELDERKANR